MVTITVKKDFPAKIEEIFAQKRDNFLEKAPQYIIDGILPKESTEALIVALTEDKMRRDKKNEDKKTAHDSSIVFHEGHPPLEKQLRIYKKVADNNPLITPEIRLELELYSEEKAETTDNKQPDLKGKTVGGTAQLSYTKKPMEGIILYSKTNDGGYDFETTVKDSKFIDTRPRKNPKLVEIREYYAYYIYNGQKVGKQSEIIRIVLNPIE